jgi:hypothetical protein
MKVKKKNEEIEANKVSVKEQKKLFKRQVNYRKNDSWSYSRLSYFDKNTPLKYKNMYIDKTISYKTSDAMKLGNLVDCLLLTPDLFNSLYYMNTEAEIKGQDKLLVDSLYKEYCNNLNEKKELKISFETVFNLAFDKVQRDTKGNIVKFTNKKADDILNIFPGSKMENYYDSLLNNYGKICVFQSEIDFANMIVKSLTNHPNTKDICNFTTKEGFEVHNQKDIYFKIKNIPFKSLLDKIIIDKKNKKIYLYDLKCSWEILNFASNRLKNKYYLQEGVYYLALKAEYPDYEIIPTKYILAHSVNQLAPIIVETNKELLKEGLNGFTTPGGKRYKGVYELIDELSWHHDNKIWNSTKEITDNKGRLYLEKIEK